MKFNDADLMGFPVRLIVSPCNLRQDAVEMKTRSEPEARAVPRDQVVA